MNEGRWAFVFARGGSKGVPRKNIRPLAGVPLIEWSIRCARESGLFERIIVSTDDEEIASVASDSGADVPFLRPRELAEDASPEWAAWRHAITSLADFEMFVSLPTTSPLRNVDDVNAAVQRYSMGGVDAVIAVTPAARHPSFNMVLLDADGCANIMMPIAGGIARRQDAAKAFDITTVCYVASPRYIMTASSLFDGRVGTIVVPRERAVDIDDEIDFLLAETLLKKRMGGT